jgi:phage FluMu protein Com
MKANAVKKTMSLKSIHLTRKHSIAFASRAFADQGLILKEPHYRNSKTLMAYSCRACGHEGKLRLNDILAKRVGCRICGIQKRFERHRINFDVLKAQLFAHGLEVLSSNCIYRGSRIQVRCTNCQKVWKAKADNLLKTRCRRCMLRERAKGRTYTTEQVRRSLKEMGILLLSDYTNSQTPIQVRFESCGHANTSTWNQLQRGDGCSKCARNARFTEEDYVEAAKKHGGKLLKMARNGTLASVWRCSLGHNFHRSLRSIRDLGTFCTVCSGSYAEMLCRTIMGKLFGRPFYSQRIKGMNSTKGIPLELDIYNESLKLAVEHNGAHHYEPQLNWSGLEGFRIQRLNDRKRRSFCRTNGILLVEIRELGKQTSIEAMRRQIRTALKRHGREIPTGFNEADLTNLPVLSESQVYWNEIQEAAHAMGLEILSRVYLGADKPVSVRCTIGHVTSKTPRSILQGHQCHECYMEQRKKPWRLSDDRVFESGAAAAKVLGVTKEVVNKAIRQRRPLKGLRIDRISWDTFRYFSTKPC